MFAFAQVMTTLFEFQIIRAPLSNNLFSSTYTRVVEILGDLL